MSTALVSFCLARLEPGIVVSVVALVVLAVAVGALVLLLAEQHDPRRSTDPWPRLRLAVTAVVGLALVGGACALVEAMTPP